MPPDLNAALAGAEAGSRECPWPVVAGCGLCCLGDPCDLIFRWSCDAQGGCFDRSTCGGCDEPDIEETLRQRALRAKDNGHG